MNKLTHFVSSVKSRVIFPVIGEVNMRDLTDEQALKIYLNGHFSFVRLSKNADKKIFAKVPKSELTALMAKLPPAEKKKLQNLIG